MNHVFFWVLLLSTFSLQGKDAPRLDCSVSKEYITTFNYLIDHKDLNLSEGYLIDVARQVSSGCHGAAKRFIATFQTLLKAELDSKSSLKLALEVALAEDRVGRAFLIVFRSAYARDLLDLDVFNATQLARKLTLEANHVPEWFEEDFFGLSRLCANEENLAIPRLQCAAFVKDIVSLGVSFETREASCRAARSDGFFSSKFDRLRKAVSSAESQKGNGGCRLRSIAKPFKYGLEFLTESEKGPGLPNYQAVALLKKIIQISPFAVQEFTQLYQFLLKRPRLPLTREQALNEALVLARGTSQVKARESQQKKSKFKVAR